MRMRLIRHCLIALLLGTIWCHVAPEASESSRDDALLAAFTQAYAGDDITAKREAVRAVSAL